MAKGREEERFEIARNMLAMGLSLVQIAEATGLDEKQICELAIFNELLNFT